MDKLLLVYNLSGAKKDNTNLYPFYLEKVINQKFNGNLKIVVSAYKPNDKTVPYLKSLFPNVDFNIIYDSAPINVTFNKTVNDAIDRYGKFDAYTYITADSIIRDENISQEIFSLIKNNDNYGIVSPVADRDSCLAYGLRMGRHVIDDNKVRQEIFKNSNTYKIPVGKAIAAHFNMYSSKIHDFYGKCLIDCMSGYCSESLFTFVCAAIKLNWIITTHRVDHTPSLDSPSGDFRPEERSEPTYYQGFITKNLEPIFNNEVYKSLGGGLEECQGIINHREDQFDNNGFCLNEGLKDYIKENLYLSKNLFDYSKMKTEWIYGQNINSI